MKIILGHGCKEVCLVKTTACSFKDDSQALRKIIPRLWALTIGAVPSASQRRLVRMAAATSGQATSSGVGTRAVVVPRHRLDSLERGLVQSEPSARVVARRHEKPGSSRRHRRPPGRKDSGEKSRQTTWAGAISHPPTVCNSQLLGGTQFSSLRRLA